MKVLNHIAAVSAWLAGSGVAAAQWSFARIADTTTPAPGGGTTFGSNNSQPFLSPCLGSNGEVAFFGRHANITDTGIFRGTPGVLQFVADRATAVPGVAGATFDQGFGSLSFDGGPVTFIGRSTLAGSGMYSSSSGVIQTLANRNTPVPQGVGNFSGVSDAYRSGPNATFFGIQAGSFLGWYRWSPSGVNTVVTSSTPVPSGTGNFSTWGFQALTGDRLAFSGGNASRLGLYSRDAAGIGPVSVIVDPDTPIPGLPGQNFAGAGYVSADGANTAFTGGTPTIGGVYAHLNDQIIRIADYTTPGPSGETFIEFRSVAISGDNVAFVALSSIGPELLVWRNGSLSRVAKFGDVLNGIPIFDLSITSQAIRGDTVAFEFHTATGGGPVSGGVYTATFIPTPGAATVLLAAALNTRRRRRA